MSCSSCQKGSRYYSPPRRHRKHHDDRYKYKREHKPVADCTEALPITYQHFAADLQGRNEVPPVFTTAHGRAEVQLASDGSHVHYKVYVYNLATAPISAHFHLGRAGTNGPVVVGLNAFGRRHHVHISEGTWRIDSPTQPLTGQQIQNLRQGLLYINVHTQASPNGEIRGQLIYKH